VWRPSTTVLGLWYTELMNDLPMATAKASPEALPELESFLRPFAPLLRYRQSRESLEGYVTGLLTDLRRKNCDTIADAVAGTSTQRLQHLLTDAPWTALATDEQRVRMLAPRSPGGGILLFDDVGLPKQGKSSVGVARQYCGRLGKVGNCQVVVTTEYVVDEPTSSRPLHWPVTARLYLPEAWAGNRERRDKAHVPEEVTFQTKPEIALDQLDLALAWEVPFAFVVADCGYGDNPHFLEGLEKRQCSYVCGVGSTFGLRLPEEVRAAAEVPPLPHPGPGQPKKPRPAPLHTTEALIKGVAEEAWRTVTWREGTKAKLSKQFVAIRAHRATGGKNGAVSVDHATVTTGPEGWLLAERPLPGEKGERKYYYSNLPAHASLERLVTLAHSRWAIEQFYEDGNGECGLDHFQGRRWDGLHRHLALVMLTYSFLMQQRLPSAASGEEGFFPLSHNTHLPRRTPTGAELAVAGLGAMVALHRPDQDLPPSQELT